MANKRIPWIWSGAALLVVILASLQAVRILGSTRPPSQKLARQRIHTVLLRAGLNPERYDESLDAQVIQTQEGRPAVEWVGAFWDSARSELFQVRLGPDGSPRALRNFRLALDPPAGRAFSLAAAEAVAQQRAKTLLGISLQPARLLPARARVIRSGSLVLGRELFWQLGARRVKALFSGDRLEALEIEDPLQPPSSYEALPLASLLLHLFIGLILVVLFTLRLRRRAIVSRAAFALAAAAVLIPAVLLAIKLLSFPLHSISVGAVKVANYSLIHSSEELRQFLGAPELTVTSATLNLIMVTFVLLVLFALVLVPVGFAEAADWEEGGSRFSSLMAVLKRGHLLGPEFALTGTGGYTVAALLFGVDIWAVFGLSRPSCDLIGQSLQAAVGGGLDAIYFFGLQGMLYLMVPTLFWALGGVALVERLPVPRTIGMLGLAALAGLGLAGQPGAGWAHSASWVLVLSIGLVRFDLLALLLAPLLERALALGLTSLWVGAEAWPTALLAAAVLAAPLLLWTGVRKPRSRRAFAGLELAPEFIRRQLLAARYTEDRQIGWSIHRQLLPQAPPQTHLAAEYFHRQEVGREFFTFVPLGAQRVGIALGEVDGEGLQAALWMTVALSALKGKARRYPQDSGQVLESLNAFLQRKLAPLGAQVRLVYSLLDLERGTLSFSNAGYIEPRLARGDGWHALGLPGAPLGLDAASQYPSEQIQLQSGDRLLFSSDWFLERGRAAAEPAEDALGEALRRCSGDSPSQMARAFLDAVLDQARAESPPEVTVVCAHL